LAVSDGRRESHPQSVRGIGDFSRMIDRYGPAIGSGRASAPQDNVADEPKTGLTPTFAGEPACPAGSMTSIPVRVLPRNQSYILTPGTGPGQGCPKLLTGSRP